MGWGAKERKEYYYANHEKCLEHAKAYRERNKEKVRAAVKNWRENNPERVREYSRKYNEEKRIEKEDAEWNNTLIELGYDDLCS